MTEKKEILKSLAKFQSECPTILKASSGYNYKYTDFPTIVEVIRPILSKNKLGFYQLLHKGKIVTVLFHTETGEEIKSVTPIIEGVELKGQNKYQSLGSGITYIKRYALSAILGIVTDADEDAKGDNVKKDYTVLIAECKTEKDLEKLWKSMDQKVQSKYKDVVNLRKSLINE